ncbi:DUF3152 domain-containing protein [Haloechinothrix sp. LS1_15]|uniref:DUF3152 domain-containing protein n=1 Tax=Haloechinothrix sp. LS1_15 TaxID=2652248 RepID=UPI0029462BD2|nr:DUF3152 domain-containing protein [Haloechinothrix sp. LS1_15]MDV6013862.1 DUF3152 domain-containing protein [Haloechinothrix sp. LS1_15]
MHQPPRRPGEERDPRVPGRGEQQRRAAARAEPLRASWDPVAPDAQSHRRSRRRPVASRIRRLGWRMYALPALVVVTMAVVLDVGGGAEDVGGERGGASAYQSDSEAGGAAGEEGAEEREPPVAEIPAEVGDVDVPSAELPDGGDFTSEGEHDWTVVDGSGEPVGDGAEHYTYTVEIEDGIDPAEYGGNDAFARTVDAVLADPRSWIGSGDVTFQRVDGSEVEPDFRVSLTTPATARHPDVCGYTIEYEASCYRRDIDRVVINLARWVRGAKAFDADIGMYRQYLINHEVGHVLGLGHVGCADDGELAPVMMQQSFGVDNDYVAKLNEGVPGEQDTVAADGNTCRPNAWPNPQANTDG